jgi:hypothetical protein
MFEDNLWCNSRANHQLTLQQQDKEHIDHNNYNDNDYDRAVEADIDNDDDDSMPLAAAPGLKRHNYNAMLSFPYVSHWHIINLLLQNSSVQFVCSPLWHWFANAAAAYTFQGMKEGTILQNW